MVNAMAVLEHLINMDHPLHLTCHLLQRPRITWWVSISSLLRFLSNSLSLTQHANPYAILNVRNLVLPGRSAMNLPEELQKTNRRRNSIVCWGRHPSSKSKWSKMSKQHLKKRWIKLLHFRPIKGRLNDFVRLRQTKRMQRTQNIELKKLPKSTRKD